MSATEWLTSDEVAAELRIDREWVTRQCKRGALRATKLGNRWRISRRALDDFLAGDSDLRATPRPGRRRARA